MSKEEKILFVQMWKKGKREVEKDELREASWLQCVTLTKTGLGEQQM